MKLSDTCQIPGLEEIYKKYFGDKKGVFIEVGAYDGETHSNTSGLADDGWRGIYVEPVLEYAAKCLERHKNNNVEVFNLAVGRYEDIVELTISGENSTTDKIFKDNAYKIPFEGFDKVTDGKMRLVYQIELWQLFSEGVSNYYDLLVVDVEGSELEVLLGAKLDIYAPKMIIIELHEKSPDWQKFKFNKTKECIDLLENNRWKYKKIYADDINSIFVRI